jgi:hypothetical protein
VPAAAAAPVHAAGPLGHSDLTKQRIGRCKSHHMARFMYLCRQQHDSA